MNIWLYGDQGTIHITNDPDAGPGGAPYVEGGQRGDDEMTEIVTPDEKKGEWRVEEEFINAIRGTEAVTRSNFTDSVKYMDFTDAVQEAWQTGRKVELPL